MLKKTALFLILVAALSGCASTGSKRTWTVQQTKDWYQKYYVDQPAHPRPFVSQMYYRGSSNKYHHFISRSMDEWVFIKIKVEDLTMTDVRPEWTYRGKSSSAREMGYYPVDPLNDFERIEPSEIRK